jgi:hypothetical protein
MHDYEKNRMNLWASQLSNGIVKQCPPVVATQTKSYVLRRLEDYKTGKLSPVKDDGVSVSPTKPEYETDENSDIDF